MAKPTVNAGGESTMEREGATMPSFSRYTETLNRLSNDRWLSFVESCNTDEQLLYTHFVEQLDWPTAIQSTSALQLRTCGPGCTIGTVDSTFRIEKEKEEEE